MLSVQPDALATSNPGCLLQIRRYWTGELPMFHPIELLDASIRGLDPISAGRRGPNARYDARTSQPGRF